MKALHGSVLDRQRSLFLEMDSLGLPFSFLLTSTIPSFNERTRWFASGVVSQIS
jgi:hypothetical protein